MPRFASYDGTEIGYRALGDGPPLVCLPGGPGRVLVTPGLAAVGVDSTEEQFRAGLERSAAEPTGFPR